LRAPATATHPPAKVTGESGGVNVEPGCRDDGWILPAPVYLADGTRIQLYKDGEALHAAYEAIKAAQHRICLEVYIFRDDDTGRAFVELLCKKARDGVSVYVIYDSVGSFGSGEPFFDRMRAAGIRLGEFHPVKPWRCLHGWRPFNRDHRKLLVIDDSIAGLGGLNVGKEYAGSWVVRARKGDQPWRDNAIGIRGPRACDLMQVFARTWRYIHQGGKCRHTEVIDDSLDRDFGILASVPTRKSPLIPFRKMIRDAKESIYLTMSYFAPPDELIDDLCNAARRGVRVRLMLPGLSDIPLMVLAARAFYDTLLAAGVEVYERQHAVLHAKSMCVDSYTSVIGSTNLDYRSIELNLELSVILRDAEFGRQIQDLFENDVCFARRITPKEWRTKPRPMTDNLIMWATKRARYLL
jgi:cardiolipin synthase